MSTSNPPAWLTAVILGLAVAVMATIAVVVTRASGRAGSLTPKRVAIALAALAVLMAASFGGYAAASRHAKPMLPVPIAGIVQLGGYLIVASAVVLSAHRFRRDR